MTPEAVANINNRRFEKYCNRANVAFLLESPNKAYRMAVAHWCLRAWITEKPEARV